MGSVIALEQKAMRDQVARAEEYMRQFPQVEMPVTHHFAHMTYARELFIPKGSVLTGKIHKYSQFNILLSGELSVLVENEVVRVKAPFRVVSPAGTKRIAYAHEDSVWITVHGTDETDLVKIEEHFIAQSEQEFLEFAHKQLGVKP